jgi:hypothetical protein
MPSGLPPQVGGEVFNSDVYDNWVNPIVAGNGGGVEADGPGLHGLAASASLTIPANGLLVFARSADLGHANDLPEIHERKSTSHPGNSQWC